jgi:hypothetical protein
MPMWDLGPINVGPRSNLESRPRRLTSAACRRFGSHRQNVESWKEPFEQPALKQGGSQYVEYQISVRSCSSRSTCWRCDPRPGREAECHGGPRCMFQAGQCCGGCRWWCVQHSNGRKAKCRLRCLCCVLQEGRHSTVRMHALLWPWRQKRLRKAGAAKKCRNGALSQGRPSGRTRRCSVSREADAARKSLHRL